MMMMIIDDDGWKEAKCRTSPLRNGLVKNVAKRSMSMSNVHVHAEMEKGGEYGKHAPTKKCKFAAKSWAVYLKN